MCIRDRLIGKLETLVSQHDAADLRRQVFVSGRIKTMNETVYYSVDTIYNAISPVSYTHLAGSLFYAVCSESKFFRDSGCIFIWSVYVYLLFRGLYESYPQNESEEFVEWKSALYDSFFLQKNSRFE